MQGQTWGMGSEPQVAREGNLFCSGEVLAGVYEIRRVLGEGGMGQVFEAQDLVLNREVAIKAYWPSAHTDGAALLRRAAQALAAIQHHGLASVFTMGTHTGTEFLVMERIRGVSLDEVMLQRHRIGQRVPQAEALRVLVALADVLHCVHAAGCVHRDVKPGNVMLTTSERLVLMDFGLFLPEGELIDRPIAAGSPGYMAPESIVDRVLRGAGHLVDLYALGVISFELMAGRLPFAADGLEEMFYQHLNAPVPDLAAAAPSVPPRLATLTKELLAKEPYDRPDSEEVLWRLRAIRDEHERSVPRSASRSR